jgi:hypothetical protein
MDVAEGVSVARKRPPSVDLFYDDFSAGVVDMDPYALGMYFRTICFQYAHDSVPQDTATLVRITGATPEKFVKHWPAVREKFVEAEDGNLINERAQDAMEKKLRISEERAKAGKKGGQSRRKRGGSKRVSKPPSKNKAKGSRKLEVGSASFQEELSAGYTTDFAIFWEKFPRGRKKSKALAFKAFQKAIASGVDAMMLIRRVDEYAASAEGRGDFVKMPSTWLNQACWDDDPAAWSRGETPEGEPVLSDRSKRTAAAMESYLERTEGNCE